ncbi:hypothetical protein NKH77_44610 [Streptomyces sp. M19]
MVGNGVLGLSVAVELARRAPDSRIAVVGPPDRERSATAAAGECTTASARSPSTPAGTRRHGPASRSRAGPSTRGLPGWPCSTT